MYFDCVSHHLSFNFHGPRPVNLVIIVPHVLSFLNFNKMHIWGDLLLSVTVPHATNNTLQSLCTSKY